VNDRRIERHDLVDNDMITLGKTNFKFKSIS
jgi:pSer/pThr/pTyr-binding forkhead associated (FHA) protein